MQPWDLSVACDWTLVCELTMQCCHFRDCVKYAKVGVVPCVDLPLPSVDGAAHVAPPSIKLHVLWPARAGAALFGAPWF